MTKENRPHNLSDAEEHEVFDVPADRNVKIWRYIDFTKFVDLLHRRALFFSRADRIGDPYEGTLPLPNALLREQMLAGAVSVRDPNISASEAQKQGAARQRQYIYVNCWHMNEVESAAMWKVYTSTTEAVAIQSTYERLRGCIPRITGLGRPPFYLGVVKYINYTRDVIPEGNVYYPFIHKRQSFSHERELRVLTRSTWGQPPTDHAVYVPVDLDDLVENVFVAPTSPAWFRELVGNVMKQYGLARVPAKSAMDLPPLY